ncbi:MAG: DNA-methyltransferase [Candidatus Helarchaeota archaeon]
MLNKKEQLKKGSKTSSFGVSKRENHDSSQFYNSKLYENLNRPKKVRYIDNSKKIPPNVLDHIILGDSRKMDLIPDNSIHLMITSPPYNVTKEYDNDLTLKEYLELLETVFSEVWRVLVPGGRSAINIANIGRKPYIPLHSYIIEIMHKIGFHMRGEIIWNKVASAGISTAWGSFASASNPCLRDIHEYILVFSKLINKLKKGNKENTIKKDDFIEWSKSIWCFPTESAKKIGHPAPFPEELPRRLIEFYSYKGDVILDPFIGSGTTAIAALKLKRHFIGYEILPEYIELANKRIAKFREQLKIDDFFLK